MKNVLHIVQAAVLFTVASFSFLVAQNPIPNPNFEVWSGNTPDGWSATTNIPGFQPITKSTDAYNGSFAVRGEVLDLGGTPLSPVLITGSISDQTFSVTDIFQTFTGRYKFNGAGGDGLYIEIVFANTNDGGGAEGHTIITEGASSFEEVTIEMMYSDDNPPGWKPNIGNISITIFPPENQLPHAGTWFVVDYFTFDGQPVSVKETGNGHIPDKFNLEQNFPNPFNPSTNINFSLPENTFASLKIFNLQGEEVETLINEELSAGSYNVDWDASGLPSGVYVYALNTESGTLSRKMILLR